MEGGAGGGYPDVLVSAVVDEPGVPGTTELVAAVAELGDELLSAGVAGEGAAPDGGTQLPGPARGSRELGQPGGVGDREHLICQQLDRQRHPAVPDARGTRQFRHGHPERST